MSCGLTAITTSAAPARRLHVVHSGDDPMALCQLGDPLGPAPRRDDLVRSPPAGREEADDQRLADPPGAENRDASLVDRHAEIYAARRARRRAMRAASSDAPGTRPSRPAEQEDLGGEPLPLLVRGEQLGGLVPVHPAAGERRLELHQGEVADDRVVVASEAFHRDDAHRPRADRGLADEAPAHHLGGEVVEALEVDRRREPGEGRRAVLREPEPSQLDRSEAPERTLRGDRVAAGPADRALERERAAGFDQLAGERSDDGVGDRRPAQRPVADERPRGRADERVAREALVELARVVVEREHETGLGEPHLVRRADDDAAVRPLPGRGEQTARKPPRPDAAPGHEPEPVRPGRRDDVLDHGQRA